MYLLRGHGHLLDPRAPLLGDGDDGLVDATLYRSVLRPGGEAGRVVLEADRADEIGGVEAVAHVDDLLNQRQTRDSASMRLAHLSCFTKR